VPDFTEIAQIFGVNYQACVAWSAMVLVYVAAMKEFVPQLQGKITLIVAAIFSIGGGVLIHYKLGVQPMVVSSLMIFGAAVGAFKLMKKMGGQ
jgi:hypothetical protein